MMRFLLALFLLAIPATADRVDDIMKVWDTNGDGILDKTEVPDAGIFARVDTNKDGKLTPAEVAKFFGVPRPRTPKRKDAKKPGTQTMSAKKAPRTVRERVADFFRRYDQNKDAKVQKTEAPTEQPAFANYDKNKDDALTRREVTRYIKAWLRTQRMAPRPDNFFDLFDMNRDNKVTRSEYTGGPRGFFRSYDHNKNGAVTRKELNLGPNANVSGRTMRADKKFMADGPTQMPKVGLLGRYDKNKDGRITLKELDGAESILHRLDRNGDGVLSGGECR